MEEIDCNLDDEEQEIIENEADPLSKGLYDVKFLL